MTLNSTRLACCLFVVLLLPLSNAAAQNSTLFGGNSFARACFEHSQTAALTGTANRLDVEDCDRAIEDAGLKKDDLVATYVNRGIVLMAMEDHAGAVRDYNKALSMSDDVGEAYINRGNLWFMYQKFPQAIEDYDNALKYGVSKPHVAYLNRGMARENLGEFEAAETDYKKALELVPEWMIARQKLDRVSKKLQ